jgi:hypothetical protein
MKNKTPLIVIFIFTAVGLLIYLLKDKIINWLNPKSNTKGEKEIIKDYQTQPEINEDDNLTEIPPIVDLDKIKVLKRGSNNKEVKYLQNLMNKVLAIKKKVLLVEDGAFGVKTETALFYLIKKKQTTLSEFSTIMVQTKGKGL